MDSSTIRFNSDICFSFVSLTWLESFTRVETENYIFCHHEIMFVGLLSFTLPYSAIF